MNPKHHDIGAYLKGAYAIPSTAATAGGSGDATEVNGATIQRSTIGYPLSAKLIVGFTTTLAATKTLSFAGNFQDSPDGSNWTDFGTAVAATVVATGESGGSTETGVFEMDVNLLTAEDYVRAQVTPDLSATGTDTATFFGIMVFGGQPELPVS